MDQKDTDTVGWTSWPLWSKGPVYQSEKFSFYLTTEINAWVLSFPGPQFITFIKWEQRDWPHLLAGILGRIKLHRVREEFSRVETSMYKSASTSERLMIWVPKRAEEWAPCQHGTRWQERGCLDHHRLCSLLEGSVVSSRFRSLAVLGVTPRTVIHQLNNLIISPGPFRLLPYRAD